jgi:hypothetical protein
MKPCDYKENDNNDFLTLLVLAMENGSKLIYQQKEEVPVV